MRLPISDQQQTRPYRAPFSHSTSLTDRRTTDGQTTTTTKGRPLSLQLAVGPKSLGTGTSSMFRIFKNAIIGVPVIGGEAKTAR